MKKIYIIIFFIFISCYESIKKPDNLIDKNEMVSILTDLYIYKQQNLVDPTRITQPDLENIGGFIIKKYKITPIQFKDSYSYYFLDNSTMDQIMNDVKKELNNKLKNTKTE